MNNHNGCENNEYEINRRDHDNLDCTIYTCCEKLTCSFTNYLTTMTPTTGMGSQPPYNLTLHDHKDIKKWIIPMIFAGLVLIVVIVFLKKYRDHNNNQLTFTDDCTEDEV